MLPGRIERAIADGVADIGITYLPIPTSNVEFVEIATVPMGIFGRKGGFKGVDFAELPFAVPVQPVAGVPTKACGIDGWPDDQFPRRHRYRVSMMESALELCRQGLAVAYLPKFVAHLHNRGASQALQLEGVSHENVGNAEQSAYIVKRRNEGEGPIIRAVASALRKTCRT
jgi:DNA-binding transcriptional LysR family regulator